jgi:RNA recognition motif-containing protein
MNIYVANLNFDLQDADLRDHFTPYGEVTSAKVIMDKITERSRGFGFVEMTDDTAGRKAIAELNGSMIDGRPIKVNEAKPRSENGFGGGGGGRGERSFNNRQSFNDTQY